MRTFFKNQRNQSNNCANISSVNFVDFSLALHSVHLTPAYLDGGTASMVFQAAIAGVLSLVFVVKSKWSQLKMMVSKNKKPSSSD